MLANKLLALICFTAKEKLPGLLSSTCFAFYYPKVPHRGHLTLINAARWQLIQHLFLSLLISMSSGGWQVYSRELFLATVMVAGFGEDLYHLYHGYSRSTVHVVLTRWLGKIGLTVETRAHAMSHLPHFIHLQVRQVSYEVFQFSVKSLGFNVAPIIC